MAHQRDGFQRGQRLDGWTLRKRLGRGGNGTVWRATHPKYGEAALNILEQRDGDRWQRFRDEAKVMRAHRDDPGVLRLVADRLPSSKDKTAWLATPIARPLDRAIGRDSELPAVVAAFAVYARTLAPFSA